MPSVAPVVQHSAEAISAAAGVEGIAPIFLGGLVKGHLPHVQHLLGPEMRDHRFTGGDPVHRQRIRAGQNLKRRFQSQVHTHNLNRGYDK